MEIPSRWSAPSGSAPPRLLAGASVGRAVAGGLAISARPLRDLTRGVAPGVWLVDIALPADPGEPGAPLRLRLPLDSGDHLVGGGEVFQRLGLRGRVLDGWVGDGAGELGYLHAPLLYCSAGWAVVVDTTLRYRIDAAVTDPEAVLVDIPGDHLRLAVVEARPLEALRLVTAMTGRPPRPPAWTFGVWHNLRGGEEAVLEQARRLRRERIPGSAVWVEDHYTETTNDGDGWPGAYPQGAYGDMGRVVDKLHAEGFRALTYINPMLYRDTAAWREAVDQGLVIRRSDGTPWHQRFFHPWQGRPGIVDFVEDIAVPVDFTNPAAVAWWRAMVRRLLEAGWDGWMEDFGEQVPPDAVLHDGTTGTESHNRYTLLYHGATAAERGALGSGDSVVFVRSGWLGVQRLAPMVWGGDQLCDWTPAHGLPSVIPAALSAALMGISTWGMDINGIFHIPEVPLEQGAGDRELWMRWCQMGALAPVMRTHLGFKPEPLPPVDTWHDAEITACLRDWGAFHVRLAPLWMSLAAEAAETGVPILRPLLLHHPDDPLCWEISDQWLLGDSLLVAPVVERGARSRRVYLPAGRWFRFATAEAFDGPAWVTVEAPLDGAPGSERAAVPMFQRAGSVVPMFPVAPPSLDAAWLERGTPDLEMHLATGGGSARLTLWDGTAISLGGDVVTLSGPERTVSIRAHGQPAGLARGADLDFDVSAAAWLAERRRILGPTAARVEEGEVAAARRAQSGRGLRHAYDIRPRMVRPEEPALLSVRDPSATRPAAVTAHWSAEAGDGTISPSRSVSLERAASGEWSATIPGQPGPALVRYRIEAMGTSGNAIPVADAGPELDRPDVEVPFAQPEQAEFALRVTGRRVPEWFRGATMYHVLVDRFAAGGGASLPADDQVAFLTHAGGTLRGVRERLGHVAELGADCLLLSPITPGEMHVGYDVKDLRAVEPRFGTLDELRSLIADAHGAGIRVVLDIELSFLGARHPLAVAARASAEAPEADLFRWHRRPRRPYSWFGSRIFMSLDHSHPRVRRELLDTVRFWLDLGVDGFRFDAAHAAPLDFWSEVAWVMERENPEAVGMAEAFGDVGSLERWHGRVDAVTDYAVCGALRGPIASGATDMRMAAAALAPVLEGDPGVLLHPGFLETHDTARFSNAAGGDRDRLLLGTAMLLTLGPPPILYYGTEVGRTQGPAQDIDPDARLPMPWGEAQDAALLGDMRRLIAMRRESVALRLGEHRALAADEAGTWSWARVHGDEAVCVVANAASASRLVEVPLGGLWDAGTRLVDRLGAHRPLVIDGSVRLLLPPRSVAVLSPPA